MAQFVLVLTGAMAVWDSSFRLLLVVVSTPETNSKGELAVTGESHAITSTRLTSVTSVFSPHHGVVAPRTHAHSFGTTTNGIEEQPMC